MDKFIGGLMIATSFLAIATSFVAIADDNQNQLNADTKKAMDSVIPLSAAEIREFMERFKDTGKATNSGPLPTRVTGTHYLEDKGQAGMVGQIYLFPHYSSTITFVDKLGYPWPVVWHNVGNKNSVGIESNISIKVDTDNNKHAMRNVLVVTPLSSFAATNAVINLENLSKPIVLDMVSSIHENSVKKNIYDVVTFVVPLLAPGNNAVEEDRVDNQHIIQDVDMLSILDGTDSKFNNSSTVWIETSSGDSFNKFNSDIFAGKSKNYNYVRTKHVLVEPEPSGVVVGMDLRVYRIAADAPVIVLRKNEGDKLVFSKI